MPPLRERREDIPLLLDHAFCERFSEGKQAPRAHASRPRP
jgi:DNA-binding NtrC family response regulator